jgi:hypothetical protein
MAYIHFKHPTEPYSTKKSFIPKSKYWRRAFISSAVINIILIGLIIFNKLY